MKVYLSPSVIQWTNTNWPELAVIGGLGAVEFQIVERLPFGSNARAMTWRGRVLVRKGWIEPALADLLPGNTLNPRHLWAISTLALHEPHHVVEQRGRWWPVYLLRYVWQWMKDGFKYREIDEEEHAYERQRDLLQRYWLQVGRYTPNALPQRPST